MSSATLPTDRDVWRIAGPMILSNMSVPLLGMVDTGVTGHLGSPIYLGAVAVGAMIFAVLFNGVNFLRMGTTGNAAQRVGAEDFDGIRETLGQGIVVALALAATFLLLQKPIANLAMMLVGATPDIERYARLYFDIRIWSAPPMLVNMVLVGWFLGLQNARVPLLMFLTVNLSNIALDLLLVYGFGMGVDGVALATVIAEYAGLAVGAAFAVRSLRRRQGNWALQRLLQLDKYRAFFAVNANLFLRAMALMFTMAFITAQGARLGPLILAANAVIMNFQNITTFGLDGFAHAAEALVGKAYGGNRTDALRRAVSLCLKWSLWFAAGFSALYLLAGGAIIDLLTDLPETREAARRYLPWIVAAPLVAVWSYLYDGVYVGATLAREMRNIMVIAAFLVFLPAWYLLQPLGNDGLWLAFLAFLASRGILMHAGYRRRFAAAAN